MLAVSLTSATSVAYHAVSMGTYDVAQICENGHVISHGLKKQPAASRKFCEECGAPTLSACPQCEAHIPGDYIAPNYYSTSYPRPSFCGECGTPYPWTRKAVDEFKGLAALVEGLDAEEREQLAATVDDLVADSPRTEGAVVRLKLLVPKLGGEAWGAMKAILINVATEAAKKQMGL